MHVQNQEPILCFPGSCHCETTVLFPGIQCTFLFNKILVKNLHHTRIITKKKKLYFKGELKFSQGPKCKAVVIMILPTSPQLGGKKGKHVRESLQGLQGRPLQGCLVPRDSQHIAWNLFLQSLNSSLHEASGVIVCSHNLDRSR